MAASKLLPAILATALGFFLMVVLVVQRDRAKSCGADFASFYTGGKLAFSPELYSEQAVLSIQREIVGCVDESNRFVRLPYLAALMYPLAQLPYLTALAVWRVLSVVALAGFIWFWPAPRWWNAIACAWSIPLLACFTFGQDVTLLLVYVALAIALLTRDKPLAAGLVLALCAAKFHLFLFVPLVILRRRLWRFGAGALAGGAVLVAASFLTAGWNWPLRFMSAATDPNSNPHFRDMVNFRAILAAAPFATWIEIALAVIAAVLVWRAAQRGSIAFAFSLAVVAGILCGRHSYLYDAALALPACLAVLAGRGPRWLKAIAVAAAAPVTYYIPALPPFPTMLHVALTALLAAAALAGETSDQPAAISRRA